MLLNFEPLLSLLFPPSSDEQNIASCSQETFLRKLHPQYINDTWVLSSFADSQIRSALHLVKFHNHPRARVLLSSLLSSWLCSLPQEPTILIPVPLSARRLKKRGYNQVALIAQSALTDIPHITLRTDILKRVRHTQSQTSLSRALRKKNLDHAFALRAPHAQALAGKRIILLDDVTTTGATLKEARKALSPLRASSLCTVALAH